MKRVLILLLAVALILSGCGKKEDTATDKVSDDQVKMDVDRNKDTTEMKTEDGHEVEVVNDLNTSLELPKDYPEDILPLYSEEMIVTAMKNPDGTHSLMCLTKDGVDKVKDYYKKILEDAQVLTTQQDGDYYFSMGEIDGSTYSVMIDVAEDEDMDDYKAYFALTLLEGQGMGMDAMTGDEEADSDANEEQTSEEDKDADSDGKDTAASGSDDGKDDIGDKVIDDLIVPENLTVPESYPEKALPFYPTGKTEAAMMMDGMVAIMTEDPIEDVLEYYEDLLSGAEDYGMVNMPPTIMLNGTLDDVGITVTIGENTGMEEKRFKTLIQIMYQ